MSKQSEAKERQQYVAKFIPNVCGNCAHLRIETVRHEETFNYGAWTEEKNPRCGLGGFAVKKMGSCIEHEGKDE